MFEERRQRLASIVPVILAGGSGSRLWPMSREMQPKQLLSLLSHRSLLQETLLRTDRLPEVAPPVVVCSDAHARIVSAELEKLDRRASAVILEQVGKNTAPALAAAALLTQADDADALLLALPADHIIQDVTAFARAVEAAVAAAATGRLVAFGIVPTAPETGYGYVRRGEPHGAWFELAAFVEKPDAATAQAYLSSGEYLWNSGMFVLPARLYLEELGRHAPAILDACRKAVSEAARDGDFLRLGPAFLECPSDSIDYAVMEKTDKAALVPLDAGWSDIGSWNALHDVLAKDADGNALSGDVLALDCKNSYVTATSRLVTAVGLEDMIVVETADAVLVLPRSRAQDVKQIVDRLKEQKRREARLPPESSGSKRTDD